MGASIYWQPTAKTWHHVEGQSSLANALAELREEVITDSHLGFLRGLAAAGLVGAEELIRAVLEHGEIRWKVEW